jgi:hypothetical protein
MPTYYLGLDVHKVRTQYCLVDRAVRFYPRAMSRPKKPRLWCPRSIPLSCSRPRGASTLPTRHSSPPAPLSSWHTPPVSRPSAPPRSIPTRSTLASWHTYFAPISPPRPGRLPFAYGSSGTRCAFAGASYPSTPPPRTHVTNPLARENLRQVGTDLFGRSGRKWLAVLELPAHTRSLIGLLLVSIDEADAHVAVLTSRLHELLEADEDMHTDTGISESSISMGARCPTPRSTGQPAAGFYDPGVRATRQKNGAAWRPPRCA